MLITKIIHTSIDLLSPDDIYNPNLDQILMDKLKERLVGKCHYSMLILNVLEIKRRSSRRLANNRLDGGASVDVQCKLEGQSFSNGEILICKIVETLNNAITAEHEYAGIKIQKDSYDPHGKSSQILKILSKGQFVPVIVQFARYNLNKDKASIIATPYLPVFQPYVVFRITTGLTANETETLTDMINIIHVEEEKHKVISKEKRYELFKSIMYPFKNLQKIDQSKEFSTWGMKEISLNSDKVDKLFEEILAISSGYIVYPSEDHKSNRRFFHTNKNIETNRLTIQGSTFVVMSLILNKYLLYLTGLRSFVDAYSSLDKAEKIAVYLQICKESQI